MTHAGERTRIAASHQVIVLGASFSNHTGAAAEHGRRSYRFAFGY